MIEIDSILEKNMKLLINIQLKIIRFLYVIKYVSFFLIFFCLRKALVELESTIACQLQSILIGSRLDTDIHANTCRLAFYGHVLDGFTDSDFVNKELPNKLRIYKRKEKVGLIDRLVDDQTIIGKDLFQKETNINAFVNFKVELNPTGEQGFIESSFGQSGKFKVRFMSKCFVVLLILVVH